MCAWFFLRFSGEEKELFQFQGASLGICISFDCSNLKVMKRQMFKQEPVIAKRNKATSHPNCSNAFLAAFSFLLGSTESLAQANCTFNLI